MGYGLAVDGQLVDRQVSVDISTNLNELARATVVFNLNAEMVENPVRIDLDEFKCQR